MNEYWRNRLDQEADKCYTYLLQGMRKKMKNVDCGNVSMESVEKAYFAIYNDHPELFYLSHAPKIVQRSSGFIGFGSLSCSSSLVVMPIYSDREIRDCELKIDGIKTELKKQITPRTTDEEKVLLAAEYLVRNTVYEINDQFNQNAASALCFGRAQCSGISKAFKLLMDELGVDCIMISGNADDGRGNSGAHAWNLVKIAGQYYHVDVTFMLGANTDPTRPLVNMYLLYDDDSMAENHTWDKTEVPKCTDKSKCRNDLSIKGFFSQWMPKAKIFSPNRDSYDRYPSLSQFRAAMKDVLHKRENAMTFYLDIGMSAPGDIAHAVKNAIKMVTEKENLNCSCAVSVSQGLLVHIEINY